MEQVTSKSKSKIGNCYQNALAVNIVRDCDWIHVAQDKGPVV